jgi:hypothetical protein
MLRAARPVFWEFRNRRVFVAQIPLVCTIDTLLRFPLRILIIVLIASAVTFPTDRRILPLEHNRFPPPKKRARVNFIPDLKVVVFVTLRAPDVITNHKRGALKYFTK